MPRRAVRQSNRGKKPYTGILLEPMPKWTALTAPTDEELSALIDAKMKALFTHYGINPTDAFEVGPKTATAWASLAWHLAREHVPGFSGPPRKRGKPATRRDDDVTLVLHVKLLMRRHGLSERKAINKIVAQRLVSGTEQALLQRYKRTKKQFIPVFRLFDNIAAAKGQEVFLRILEESLSGDDKDTFLSPD
jgi:hypothetical protein